MTEIRYAKLMLSGFNCGETKHEEAVVFADLRPVH